MTHFEKCKVRKKSRGTHKEKDQSAVTQKRILCRIAANELDKMSKAVAGSSGTDFDSEKSGRKRKSDAAALASPPQKRRTVTGDTPVADSGATVELDSAFALPGITASTTGLYISSFIMAIWLILPQDRSYSFSEAPRLNGHDNRFPIGSGEFPTSFMANNEPFLGQYAESPLRAPVFSSRTMDWNLPRAGGQIALLYPQEITSHFAEIVTADVEGVDQSHDSDARLMALYRPVLAVGRDSDGPMQTV